ncbi:hypothetical protein V8F06_002356 [Rhypophila decipiens]
MTMPVPRMEILAHVAAPSRAVDDTRYRTQARGYLDFRPTRRTAFFEPPSEGDFTSQNFTGFETQHNSQLPRHVASFNLGSPQLSFRSVENNLNSPLPLPRQQTHVRPQHSQVEVSWQEPPSEIPDSFPDSNLPLPEFCSPTRLLEHYLSIDYSSQLDHSPLARRSGERQRVPISSSQETTRPFSSPEQQRSQIVNNDQGNSRLESVSASQRPALNTTAPEPPTTRSGSQKRPASTENPVPEENPSSHGPQIPEDARGGSVIPQSPPLPSKPPLPAQPTTRSSGDVTHISSSHLSENEENEAPCRAESEPPQSKRARRFSQDPSPGKILPRSTSDIGPRRQKPSKNMAGKKTPANSFRGLEIRSPEPPVSDDPLRPDDLIAEAIGNLARELDLSKRFRPASQTREIRPFERGHWLIDCTTWDDELKWSSWAFLANYLPKGLAGWGVWCERDPEFSRIRLWCFGYMVGHLHLLIYLCSCRQVLFTGSSWIAADGKPVIVMGVRRPSG